MNRMFRKMVGVFLLSFLLWQNGILAQHQEHSDHLHAHPENEIGLGNYLSYLAGEQEFAFGLHVHYLRSLGDSRFGAGIGFEQLFSEHRHQSLTIIGTYSITSPLMLSLAPGILFGNPEHPANRFVLHTELIYEFHIGNFHLGPALEFATTFDEYHIGLGLHVALAF